VTTTKPLVSTLLVLLVFTCCSLPEDPARTAFRARLQQNASLSSGELAQLLDTVRATTAAKRFRIKEGTSGRELDDEQRTLVFGMLSNPAGLFDEGLKRDGGSTFRVLNAPGEPLNAEVEASRRLWIDIETFLPRHFEFSYAVPGFGDYGYDLVVQP